MRALVVDDDPVTLALLQDILEGHGYAVETAVNGREGLEALRRGGIRLVITDWQMPEMNGLQLCSAIRTGEFDGYIYIIMITAQDGPGIKIEGLSAGADSFLQKPLDPAELQVCLKTAQRILSLETRDVAMFALAKLAESRDPETGSHLERVQAYTRLLTQDLSRTEKYAQLIDGEYLNLIHQTSPLHDIGKVGIPDHVLLKPGKLNPEEMAIMRTHTQLGAHTLDASLQRFPGARFLEMARDIAATHHEKFDGTGYPAGLRADQIPLCGRIVALADVYDALTSKRVYKRAMPHEQARDIIFKESGAHFDPDVVASFRRNEAHFIAIKKRLADSEEEPLPPALPVAVAAAVPAGSGEEKILIVEDDESRRRQLISMVELAGHQVVHAVDMRGAMRAFREHRPRVIVANWDMPGGSGLDLCGAIRDIADVPYTHFIMISAFTGPQRFLEAFDGGANDFIREPFDPIELLARIRAGLRVVRLQDELSRRNDGSEKLNQQLAGLNQRLEKLAITDDLTGLYNRRHAQSRLEEQWALADRYNRPLTIAVIDIDHFKEVNDMLGHSAGDAILRQATEILKQSTRATDTVCRVGGDEFLILFPAQGPQDTLIPLERARFTIEAREFIYEQHIVRLTVSIGVASRWAKMAEPSELIARADQALYAAKVAGRNAIREFAGNVEKQTAA